MEGVHVAPPIGDLPSLVVNDLNKNGMILQVYIPGPWMDPPLFFNGFLKTGQLLEIYNYLKKLTG